MFLHWLQKAPYYYFSVKTHELIQSDCYWCQEGKRILFSLLGSVTDSNFHVSSTLISSRIPQTLGLLNSGSQEKTKGIRKLCIAVC